MSFADRVTAARQRGCLFVVHGHTGERLTHMKCRSGGIGLAVKAFRIDVDEAHLHCSKRVLERVSLAHVAITGVRGRNPIFLRTPVNVFLGGPDVFAAEREAVSLQTHRLVSHRAGEEDQVGPGNLVAVLLLDRPQDAARLVEVAVIRPGVQRSEADVACAAAAATVCEAVGTSRVPGQANHQAAVVPPVSRPPFLAVGHQGEHILLQRFEIERLDGFAVVEVLPKGADLGVMLVKDVEVQGLRPPGRVGPTGRRERTVHHGAFGFGRHVFSHCG